MPSTPSTPLTPGTGAKFDGKEVPLAPGEIYGLRSFKVSLQILTGEVHPVLTGVVHASPYVSGENTAVCHCLPGWNIHLGKLEARYFDPSGHVPGQKGAGCGFYAYWDGSDEYADGTNVNAVVRAWGRITYGDRGFRAQKLQIVAAVDPYLPGGYCHRIGKTPVGASPMEATLRRAAAQLRLPLRMPMNRMQRYASNLYRGRSYAVPLLGGLGVGEVVVGTLLHLWATLAIGILVLGWLVFGLLLGSRMHVAEQKWQHALEKMQAVRMTHPAYDYARGTSLVPEHYAALRETYPEIQWYPTTAAMLAAHPLTRYEDLPR